MNLASIARDVGVSQPTVERWLSIMVTSDYPLYFCRNRDGNEIDLLVSEGNTLNPVKIKKNADPDKSDVAKFIFSIKSQA